MSIKHISVLKAEAVENLKPEVNKNFIDCTIGGGGHAADILEKTSPDGKLLAIDLDDYAINKAKDKLKKFDDRVVFVQQNFSKLKQIYDERFSLFKINGILLDLGFSSFELEREDRGFSFQVDGPLDMRYDLGQSLTAAEIVNTWPIDKLKKVNSGVWPGKFGA